MKKWKSFHLPAAEGHRKSLLWSWYDSCTPTWHFFKTPLSLSLSHTVHANPNSSFFMYRRCLASIRARLLIQARMARKPPPKVQVSVNSRRGDSTIHPADVEAPPVPPPPAKRPVLMHPEFKQHLVKKWFPWLTISFVVANVVMFVVTMYVNDCPKNSGSCVAGFLHFLGRFSFQPFKQNPLLGPSPSA